MKVAGYSPIQMKRLISEWKDTGLIFKPRKVVGTPARKYHSSDIQRIIDTDLAHNKPNGIALKKYFQRQFAIFGDSSFENICNISVSHIYNIRKNNLQYTSVKELSYTKTQAVSSEIGERRKPDPGGIPGYLRVDSVHQGDFKGIKGVYHINIVDEITQWEYVGCVPQISREYMIPLLRNIIEQCPFTIHGFHSDNGSEYINHDIKKLLRNFKIHHTKSRSRKSNDQALVEGKNGSVIRKHMGRNFIHKDNYQLIQEFYDAYFNDYLNYHRVCLFPTDYVDKRGKVKKKYIHSATPYERLRSLKEASSHLKKGLTFQELDVKAFAQSDNEAGLEMRKARGKLFSIIQEKEKKRRSGIE